MANFSELDRYLFGQATHYEIYRKLGAHPTDEYGIRGVCFDLWAPNAARVWVIGSFNGWDEGANEMKRLEPNFKYTDSILSDWNKKQVHHLSDIAKLDAAHQERKKSSASAAANTASKNKFNNFTQRSYDYDELEQMLLTTNAH